MTILSRDARRGRKVITGSLFEKKTPEVVQKFTAQKNEDFSAPSFSPDFQGGPSALPG